MESLQANNSTVKGDVLVLLSGGIDSTACLAYYVSLGYTVSAIFIDYGQPSSNLEWEAANAVSSHYSVPLKHLGVIDCNIPEGYVPARNAMLLSLALMSFEFQCGIISIGIHAGTSYVDCSPCFEQAMQRIFDLYEQGRVRIDAPFLHWTKREILDYAKVNNVPLYLTYSTNLDDLRSVPNTLRQGN